jgi:hypothetical protein
MKRFAVFSYPRYYPQGGWGDNKGIFATIEEAKATNILTGAWDETPPDGGEIVDLETDTIVSNYDSKTKQWVDI